MVHVIRALGYFLWICFLSQEIRSLFFCLKPVLYYFQPTSAVFTI